MYTGIVDSVSASKAFDNLGTAFGDAFTRGETFFARRVESRVPRERWLEKMDISRDEASTFRNGRTVYNSTGEKTVRGNSIDAKQLDDNAPHLSLSLSLSLSHTGAIYGSVRSRAISSTGLGSFVMAEIRSPSRRDFLIIQFRATPTALACETRGAS